MSKEKIQPTEKGTTKADNSDKEQEAASKTGKSAADDKKQAENTNSLEQGESD